MKPTTNQMMSELEDTTKERAAEELVSQMYGHDHASQRWRTDRKRLIEFVFLLRRWDHERIAAESNDRGHSQGR